MFMDRKTQYCQNICFSELDLYIQHNTKQKCSKLSCNYWQSDSKTYMEKQKIQNSKLNIEGEEQSQRPETIRL